MNIGILAPGKGSSEYNIVLFGMVISACWILGLDIQPFLALLLSKETAELIGNVSAAHPRGDWQAVVGMWVGISVYTGVRGWLKAKCPAAKEQGQ